MYLRIHQKIKISEVNYMKVSKREWLICGKYINIDVNTSEVIIKNLKFKFTEKIQENLFNLVNVLNVIDAKGYNLNVRLYTENNVLNLEIDVITEKYIFKNLELVNLSIN
jgi:hypothetical protein